MHHTVKTGETLSGIAKAYGISTWGTLYYAEQNQDFRSKRPNPNRIFPGDTVWIPDAPKGDPKPQAAKSTPAAKPTGPSVPRTVHGQNAQNAILSQPVHAGNKGKGADAEPLALHVGDLARGSAFIPDNYLTFLGNLFGARRFELNDMADHVEKLARATYKGMQSELEEGDDSGGTLKPDPKFEKKLGQSAGVIKVTLKGMDAIEGFAAGYDAYRLIKEGRDPRIALGKILKCMSKLWATLPAAFTDSAVRSVAGLLGKVEKLRPIANIAREFQYIGASADFISLMSSLVLLDQAAAAADFRNLIQVLSRNKHAATRMAPSLVTFFVGLVPNHMKAKLLAKAGVRKVPVIGTAIMAVSDIVEIVSEHMKDDMKKDASGGTNDYLISSKYAGLASTLMGLVPGVGTAGSVLADVIGIGLVAIGEIQRLELDVKPLGI